MYKFIKRFFDVLIALIGIIMLSPLFLVLSIIVLIDSPGPIFYKGNRTRLGGDTTFKMYKFRTMVVDSEKKGGFSTAFNDPRLTRSGRFFRKYKLDELPQLLNVLFGQMSLVGPRPQVKFYTDLYKGEEKRIMSVKPGITDFASLYFSDMDKALGTDDVDQKYFLEIEPKKNKLRLQYVYEASLLTDIKIFFLTIKKVFLS